MLTITLDIARGLASLWVVLFHLKNLIPPEMADLYQFASAGTLGVPAFFVISGYCMMSSAQRFMQNDIPSNVFIWKRFLRIYPTYWSSILVIACVPVLLESLSYIKTGNFHAPSGILFQLTPSDWLQYLTLTRVFFNEGGDLPHTFSQINIVYWTLAIEFQFYVIMFLALLNQKFFYPIIVFVTIISGLSFAFEPLRESGIFLNYWPSFAAGLLLYTLLKKKNNSLQTSSTFRSNSSILLGISIIACLLAFIVSGNLNQLLNTPWDIRVLIFGCLFFIIFYLIAPFDSVIENLKIRGPVFLKYLINGLVLLGLSSYSLYLTHTKLYQIPHTLVRQFISEKNMLSFFLVISGTVIIAYGFYLVFEKPIIAKKNKIKK